MRIGEGCRWARLPSSLHNGPRQAEHQSGLHLHRFPADHVRLEAPVAQRGQDRLRLLRERAEQVRAPDLSLGVDEWIDETSFGTAGEIPVSDYIPKTIFMDDGKSVPIFKKLCDFAQNNDIKSFTAGARVLAHYLGDSASRSTARTSMTAIRSDSQRQEIEKRARPQQGLRERRP
jgi:hypothetical protein